MWRAKVRHGRVRYAVRVRASCASGVASWRVGGRTLKKERYWSKPDKASMCVAALASGLRLSDL